MPQGVDLGLIGMQQGGIRKITVPPPMLFTSHANANLSPAVKDQLMAAKISLRELSPALPSSSLPLRAINTVFGDGKQVACGDKVYASVSLWKTDGTQLFSSDKQPLVFTLGQSQMPYGIEQGMKQMMEEGERIVIIPPGYSKPLIADVSSGPSLLPVTLPDNEILVAKIQLLHIGDYPVKKSPVPTPTPVQKQ